MVGLHPTAFSSRQCDLIPAHKHRPTKPVSDVVIHFTREAAKLYINDV